MALGGAALRISLATVLVVAGPGCSLVFTHAPQPEVHPPPECTTSVAAPVVDTVLATAGVTFLGLGVGVVASSCTGQYCELGRDGGWAAVIVGAVTGALFITSAVVGYQRTSACRASLEPSGLPRPPGSVPAASLLWPLPEACAPVGDAPRTGPRTVLSPGGG
jgi:hypothetical protein